MDYCKILILGSLPYKSNAQSRAFDSYFHYWPKEKLHQFFSSPFPPVKGHCSEFYQVTDYRIFKRNFNHKIKVERIFYDKDLDDFQDNSSISNGASKLYKLGKHKTSLKRLLRKFIWKKRYWCTEDFNKWVDEFKPDVVFLAWSDDFYMLNIANFICQKYNLPLISCVGDDYFFNIHFSFSPLYWIYKYRYRKLARNVLKLKGSHIYISDKIMKKYNDYFSISGKTIHVACDNPQMPDRIPKTIKNMVYFGNLGYGRYKTLITFAKLVNKKHQNLIIHIYSNEQKEHVLKQIKNTSNIIFHGAIPYKDIKDRASDYDCLIIAEELSKKRTISDVKYSLSTKVGDSLSFGMPIVAIGNAECGAIEFIKNANAGIVLETKEDILNFSIDKLDSSVIKQKIDNAKKLLKEFNKQKSCDIFKSVVDSVLQR